MILTKEEKQELEVLRGEGLGNVPLNVEHFNRLIYLNNKQMHNCCSNPYCSSGYIGEEKEINCPHCGCKLIKLLWQGQNLK